METRTISVEIPKIIKKELSRICFGLPDVTWYESTEFYLNLFSLEFLDPSYDLDIIEVLKKEKLTLPVISIIEIKPYLSKAGKGQILFLVNKNNDIEKFKKSLEKLIKQFPIKIPEYPENLTIPVGYFDKISSQKLADWMEGQAFFPEISFKPEKMFYLKPHFLKNRFFSPLEQFSLSE